MRAIRRWARLSGFFAPIILLAGCGSSGSSEGGGTYTASGTDGGQDSSNPTGKDGGLGSETEKPFQDAAQDVAKDVAQEASKQDAEGGTTPECENGKTEPCGTDEGACSPGYRSCANGVWGQCLNAKGPADETCDGLDHDCDGTPNNPPGGCDCEDGKSRSCYGGPANTEGKGTCKAGTQSCLNGQWGACQDALEPKPGKCDEPSCTGEPNPNCGCTIGEKQDCYSGPSQTLGLGKCRGGVKECIAQNPSGSKWGLCVGEIVPEDEQCDGMDHNCNDVKDDAQGGCECSASANQPCYTGTASTLGKGTCAEGTQTCVLSGGKFTWGKCQGDVAPVPGDCDHPSCTGPNDLNPGCSCLNGKQESCYSGPEGTQDVGACRTGQRTCVDGSWNNCVGQVPPTTLDACVAGDAEYSANEGADLNCNKKLDRHSPSATPSATAQTAVTLASPPAGHFQAIQVLPLDTVTLHAAATDADGQGGFGYRWRLISAPTGNTAGLSGAPGATPANISTEQNPTLFAQLVGDYVIGVRANDSTGCEGEETTVLVRVKPNTAVHIQLTWDKSVDLDLQLSKGSIDDFGAEDSCFFNNPNPDWGEVDPSLDIDDVAGCNPENIHFGEAGGPLPPLNSTYAIFVHYFEAARGHRVTEDGDPTLLCYQAGTEQTTPVTGTVRVYVDGQLAKIDGTSQDAVFTMPLEKWDVWTPALLSYEGGGIWRVTSVQQIPYYATTTQTSNASCVCGGLANNVDPYCGPNGAACRQLYP